MSIARTPSVLTARLALDWPCAWLAANESADWPMATAAAADKPAFSTFRRDNPSAQLRPSDAFIGFSPVTRRSKIFGLALFGAYTKLGMSLLLMRSKTLLRTSSQVIDRIALRGRLSASGYAGLCGDLE